MNVRSTYSTVPLRNAVTKDTLPKIKDKIQEIQNYIKSFEVDVVVKLPKTKNSMKASNKEAENQVYLENIINSSEQPQSFNDYDWSDDFEIDDQELVRILNEYQNNEMQTQEQDHFKIVRIPVIDWARTKTGFLGFYINLCNYEKLAETMLQQKEIEFLLSYKLSQDHVELFFSLLRSMNGFNNNPTVEQYLAAMRKILIHDMEILLPRTANCIPQDETSIAIKRIPFKEINSLKRKENNNDPIEISDSAPKNKKFKSNSFNIHTYLHHPIKIDHDYIKSHQKDKDDNIKNLNEDVQDIIKHTAGAVIRSLKIHQTDWYQKLCLEKNSDTSRLTELRFAVSPTRYN